MDPQIIESIELNDWLLTPPGEYMMAWEQKQFDKTVANIFGYHALQLGMPAIDALGANRMPHKWTARVLSNEDVDENLEPMKESFCTTSSKINNSNCTNPNHINTNNSSPIVADRVAIVLDSRALPFPDQCLDLIVLPHTLEMSADPHSTLREVERVLVPEGRVVISGLNPVSLWGFHQKRVNTYCRLGLRSHFLPQRGEFIGYWRLRDWLKLLSFEVEGGQFGGYRPAFKTDVWLNRCAWMDKAGDRWWPIFGSFYFLVAIKKVRGMKMLGAVWKRPKARGRAVASGVNSSTLKQK
jgi:SAM-dependent methyltransferase